ncbi:MoaD/ThiS family protein [Oerskovia flava]|uniref:MoaD/ThiS family protein n=1 Tax=Oerskovia flava TaxID=2986422 RepID=UPI00223F6527|nr:MoaD/ThiS family protein [Oerskovia sp. JB1-3-2]
MPQVRYFAGAAEAAGMPSETVPGATVGELFTAMTSRHPALTDVLPRCSVLVEGVRTADPDVTLDDDQTVDVLPPFSGG